MSSPGTIRFAEVNVTPSAPPVGYNLLYVKTDDILYLQDSSGIETPLGSSAAITQLSGEATAVGPGNAVITLSNSAVISKVLTGFTPGPNSPVLATDTILEAFEKLQAQSSASSSSAITALTGDVSATGPGSVAATVNSVGGKTSTEIAQSVSDTQAATSANTPSTIVTRDASGNFSAGIITANLSGNATSATSISGTNTVTNSNLAQMPANTLKGNNTGITANAADLTIPQVVTMFGGTPVTQIPDQANAAGTSNTFSRADHIHNIPSGIPVQIGTTNIQGSASAFSLSDHVHSHGNQTTGTLHAIATTSVNGFMSSTDKTKLDIFTSLPGTNAQVPISNGTTISPQTISGDATITNAGVVAVNSVTGTIPVNKGGTGQTSYTDGQLLIGNTTGNTLNKTTLTAGTGISITNGSGSITIATSGSSAFTTKTANYTILSTDGTIFVDSTGGAFTLTLPNPSGLGGKIFRIIGTSGTMNANPVTLARFGSEKIEGLTASKVLQTSWGWFNVTTDGVDWYVG